MKNKHDLPRKDIPTSSAELVRRPLIPLAADDVKRVVGGYGATTLRENTMFNSVGNIR
jgi:hypothetical protein